MASEDEEYRKNARNMVVFVAVLVVLVIVALVASALLSSPRATTIRPATAKASSFLGFDLVLSVNETRVSSGSALEATVAINNTSGSILNLTTASSWPVERGGLVPTCDPYWPIGMGVMEGHYTRLNYTGGSLIQVFPTPFCPVHPAVPGYPPEYFLVRPSNSSALGVNGAGAQHVDLSSSYTIPAVLSSSGGLSPGVYTLVAADEWGDAVTVTVSVI